jgi:hypothetical protein
MRGLSFGELLDYSAEESNHWRDFFTQHPDALDVPCDIAQTKTVRELVLHIVIVQMRYAERLLNMPSRSMNRSRFRLNQRAQVPNSRSNPCGAVLLSKQILPSNV